jgi:hypothetical protein
MKMHKYEYSKEKIRVRLHYNTLGSINTIALECNHDYFLDNLFLRQTLPPWHP